MNSRITFYDSSRSFEPTDVTWPEDCENLDLKQVSENLVLSADINIESKVDSPFFYVCRKKGVLMLNRYTYVAVTIPDSLIDKLRHTPNIEVQLTFPKNDVNKTVYAEVKHLLRFPEFLTNRRSRSMARGTGRDGLSLDGQDENGEDDIEDEDLFENAPDMSEPDSGDWDDEDDEESKWPRIPPRLVFGAWIASQEGEILFESDAGYVIAHDGHNLLLVSFFDRNDSIWIADEQFPKGEAPTWISVEDSAVSPVYELRHVVARFIRLTGCRFLPLVIVSDHIELVGAEYAADTWKDMKINVCYCLRKEESMDSFGHFLASAAKNAGDYPVPDADSLKALKAKLDRSKKENE